MVAGRGPQKRSARNPINAALPSALEWLGRASRSEMRYKPCLVLRYPLLPGKFGDEPRENAASHGRIGMDRVEAQINPKVVEWARKMTGLTVDDAAQKLQISANRLREWESGARRPTITQLRKIATVFKRPLALFYFDSVPIDDIRPTDFRRMNPDTRASMSRELRLAIREATARREIALELIEELEERAPDFAVSASPSTDPEEVGRQLRAALLANGLPPRSSSPYSHLGFWRSATEDAGVLVFQAEGVEVSEMRGFSIADRPLPAIILNIKDSVTARNFSLLHELAHVAIRRGGLCDFEGDGPMGEGPRVEAFCNHVAGAALLPSETLLTQPEVPSSPANEMGDAEIEQVAARFGASREALLRRLVILRRVSPAFYLRKRHEISSQFKVVVTSDKPSGFAPPSTMAVTTNGKLFTRLVFGAYDNDRISADRVAEYLGVRTKHWKKIRQLAREGPPAGDVL